MFRLILKFQERRTRMEITKIQVPRIYVITTMIILVKEVIHMNQYQSRKVILVKEEYDY